MAMKCLLLTQNGHWPSFNDSHLNRYDLSILSLGEAMRRREFLSLFGGAQRVALPSNNLADKRKTMRRHRCY
jgi:hypothetical protein